MLVNIISSFLIALLLEMFSIISRYFKSLAILAVSITFIIIYFISGCQLVIINEMDFSLWLIFIIFFDEVLMLLLNKYFKALKDRIKD